MTYDKPMTKEELQFDLLKTEMELTQRQLDKYDQLSGMTKTWAVTLWIAALGWSFQTGQRELALLAAFAMLMFWALDANNKNARQDYRQRRNDVSKVLQRVFRGEALDEEVVAPYLPFVHKWGNILKAACLPHICLLYLSLIAVSLILYWRG